MDIDQLLIQLPPLIAEKVLCDLNIRVALIGAGGVVAGSIVTILGQWFLSWWKNREKRSLDKQRENLLKALLENAEKRKKENQDNGWSKIETLSRVIGADENETKRLLIKINARGSAAGNDVWALISNKPLLNVGEKE